MSYSDSDLIPNDIQGQFPSGIFTEVIPLSEFETPESIYRFYKALRYGRWHLLKALRPERATEPLYRQLLFKEFEIGYRLSHPNIVQTLGLEEVPGVGQAIVLEYVDGLSVREAMDAGTLTTAQFRKVLSQICSALSYLHSLQIIHRDIKPENILITRNGGNVKLIDFSLSDADSYAVLKGPAGTRRYAAPELLRGEPADARADVYALGVMMREAGRFPRLARRCHCEEAAQRPTAEQTARQLTHHGRKWYVFFWLLLALLFAGSLWRPLGRSSKKMAVDTVVRVDTIRIVEKDTVATSELARIQRNEAIFQDIHREMLALIRRRIARATAVLDTLTLSPSDEILDIPFIGSQQIHQEAQDWSELQLRERLSELDPQSASYLQFQTTLKMAIIRAMMTYGQQTFPEGLRAAYKRGREMK